MEECDRSVFSSLDTIGFGGFYYVDCKLWKMGVAQLSSAGMFVGEQSSLIKFLLLYILALLPRGSPFPASVLMQKAMARC